MTENLNIVAEYGKLHFKLRKLKQLDQQRIKLIQQVAKEASEMDGFGENARFIFDLPSNMTSTEKQSSSSSAATLLDDTLPESLDKELVETLKQLESMAIYLEKGVNELFESGRISSQQFLEIASQIPEEPLLSEYLQVQGGRNAHAKNEADDESKDNNNNNNSDRCVEDNNNNILFDEIHTSDMQSILCQWEDKSFVDASIGEGSHDHLHFATMLAELRQKNEDILRKVVRACEPLSPFEIHLS
jgi:hypothetical protein